MDAGEPACLEQDEINRVLARSASAMLAASRALPLRGDLEAELECVEAAARRGYFLPDEDELIRLRYAQYLGLRTAMLETFAELEAVVGRSEVEWRDRLPVFSAAFATACVASRADRYVVELAAERPVVWKKLDEEDVRTGIPRKTFTGIYKAVSHPANLARLVLAADFYRKHRGEIMALAGDPVIGPVVELLAAEEPMMEARWRDALKRHLAYRLFSFLRRNRSAWKNVTFGIFEASGRAVAELRVPGVKPSGAPKRISGSLRDGLLKRVRPGDVFVTRHDDAVSNLFLPGYWPHAALYLGTAEDLERLGIPVPVETRAGPWFLESKKDGVRVRPAEETLQVDALVVLRPPLEPADLMEALRRAASHAGKPYDFLFDFRTADRMVCTEVVYRGFHGIGPVKFHLEEVGGRLCLPAEQFVMQAMDCGFRITASAGLRGDVLLSGMDAELAFHDSRQFWQA
jgi:hypothetical protein